VNIAQSASTASRIAIVEELFISLPLQGRIPVPCDGLPEQMGAQQPKRCIFNQLQMT
jgi:hypothetical protein